MVRNGAAGRNPFIRNLREPDRPAPCTPLFPRTFRQFQLILGTTPPEFDDTHYSFELPAPPPEIKFQPRAEGNWYTSRSGIRVHRADAFDTALAGKKIFDLKTGAEISPQEAYHRAPNKDGHRIAHWLTWMLGGSAACKLACIYVPPRSAASTNAKTSRLIRTRIWFPL